MGAAWSGVRRMSVEGKRKKNIVGSKRKEDHSRKWERKDGVRSAGMKG